MLLQHFQLLLNKKYSVSYDERLDWFLGMKFEWQETNDDLRCLCHKESFVLDMVDRYNLSESNGSPRAVPFKRGLLLDTIPDLTLPDDDQLLVTKQYQVG